MYLLESYIVPSLLLLLFYQRELGIFNRDVGLHVGHGEIGDAC